MILLINIITLFIELLKQNLLKLLIMLNKIKIQQIKKSPTFKVDDYVKISKYKNIFAKGNTPN